MAQCALIELINNRALLPTVRFCSHTNTIPGINRFLTFGGVKNLHQEITRHNSISSTQKPAIISHSANN